MSVGAVLFGDGAYAPADSAEPPSSPPSTQRSVTLATADADTGDIDASLDKVMAIEGAFAAALVDYDNGQTLGVRNTSQSFDIEAAASENTQLVRSKLSIIQALGIVDRIGDISITCATQHHIVRPLSAGHLFLYLAVDRQSGHLGMARHSLACIERELSC